MNKGYLLDTTALINIFRADEKTVSLLEKLHEDAPLAVCPVNIAEIYAGIRPREKKTVEEFLRTLEYYEISYEAAKLAGSYKLQYAQKGITLALDDMLIAATVVENNLTLVTNNKKHYPMVKNIIEHS